MNKTTNIKLNKEEKDLNQEIAVGEFVSVQDLKKEKAKYQKIAKDTFAKMKTINVRISERNLMRLREAAAKEGVSYQTLITSMLHKNI